MNNLEKMQKGEVYSADETLVQIQQQCADILRRFNNSNDVEERDNILNYLLESKGKNVEIKSPFTCDFGRFISVGDNTFINYGCIILDGANVIIEENVLIGPRVSIFAVSHPIPPEKRHCNIAKPVVIKDNAWIGGGAIINPGVTIGENSIIGAGSVVLKNIPANVIAAGNPCKIIKEIT